ncbi:methyl-CpG-binding domain protein 1b isoform X8 [Gymnodraco acuticeps]|uniref:Methyl-CpG-binding domain protein 1b isoform X8 n=1 Tax=Gymnodraco acuticeps TaxID=8218 RepID=A0A6P8TV04_GYMAC|nr:methyl-CpG-binding domain protein 1b isoform X8 [Gymnodraco acuticeps]
MNMEPVGTPVPVAEPQGKDVGSSPERIMSEAGNTTDKKPHSSDPLKETPVQDKEEDKPAGLEPPVDWFEPLEEDDNDEVESLAGESEMSVSGAGSEKNHLKVHKFQQPRRKRSSPEEGWDVWPILGDGWKRKEVIRRSGSSIGQKDVYYISPKGDRVRSRVELTSVLEGVDLSTFEYKSGRFIPGGVPPTRVRIRAKRKIPESSSSESSFVERGEGTDTPDSLHRLTPNLGPKTVPSQPTVWLAQSTVVIPTQQYEYPPAEKEIKLPLPSSSRALPLPSINGDISSEENTLVCSRCGISFTGTWYDKQRKRPFCPTCWAASKTKVHPMVRFRKWIPCGQCVGCLNTVNCGHCANCKNGLQSPESRKRLCRGRKCICPIRKSPGSGGFVPQQPYNEIPDTFEDCLSFQSEVTDSQHLSLKSSDTENFSINVDIDDDDDMSTDDDDDMNWNPEMTSADSLSYELNVRNHQSSMQSNHLDFELNGLPDRVPHTSSDNNNSELDQLSRLDAEKLHADRHGPKCGEEDDDEDDDYYEEEEEEEEDELPIITQIFSMADSQVSSGVDSENQLMKLLQALRSTVMPILWYAILVNGPQLQIIQCSKQSNLTDAIVLIDPGFCYQVTVQKQPLLPTHPLYDKYPAHLTSATEVVNLLLGLEEYVVCQGLPPKDPLLRTGPIILERASTCDFLVKKKVSICSNCRALQGL